jgi:hypothetical protein
MLTEPIADDPAIDRSFGSQSVSSDQTGSAEVHWENLSFGIACLHFGRRGHEA